MAKQEKFITSHRSRVKRANDYVADSPEKISIFDREAIVEFYLLEDIIRLYQYRFEVEQKKQVETRAGKMAQERNLAKFQSIIEIFKSATEIAWGQITSGNYKAVWKSIPEHQLAAASNNVKNLPVMKSLAIDLIKELSNEQLKAEGIDQDIDNLLTELEDHEANVRSVAGLPPLDEIKKVIDDVTAAIPDKAPKGKLNIN